MRSTHTFVKLPVSALAYVEIRKALEDAGYHHAIMQDGAIDMHGIAIEPVAPNEAPLFELKMPRHEPTQST